MKSTTSKPMRFPPEYAPAPRSIFYAPRMARRRRGSIIVLVVAVLALLAIIGTVYIVSSRTERGTAQQMQAAYNLDLAQAAFIREIQGAIGDDLYDANGNPGGVVVAAAGPFGNKMARRWTIRETPTLSYGTSDYNAAFRDQTWLASSLYRTGTTDLVYQDLSLLPHSLATSATSYVPAAFNPSTGLYDLAYTDLTNPADARNPYINVISGYDALNPGSYSKGNVAPSPYPAAADPTVPLADSVLYLLPFSDASGIRYRVGLRIVDTSAMANLNVGVPANPSPDTVGQFFNSYSLSDPALFNTTNSYTSPNPATDNPNNLDLMRGGPSWTPPAGPLYCYAWGRQALSFELNTTSWPFDFSDELELRSYGNMGTNFVARPAMNTPAAQIWPNNLGNVVAATGAITGNPRREKYTTYSYASDRRPFADPVNTYTLTPALVTIPASLGTAAPNWPPYPARVSVNQDVSAYTGMTAAAQSDYLAMAATNIASSMEQVGYSHQEACAFAANYLTYRWNSWVATGNDGTSDIYSLPGGPSFVDDAGICLRAGPTATPTIANYTGAKDLKAERTKKIYLGFAAQPFINEVAASIDTEPSGAGFKADVIDFAVELYNPFAFALDLTDYQVYITVTGGTAVALPLAAGSIPAHGYFVLSSANGRLDAKAAAATGPKTHATTATLDGATMDTFKLGGQVILMRKYTPRLGGSDYAAIDQFNYTKTTDPANTPGTTAEIDDYFIERINNTNADYFMPSVCDQTPTAIPVAAKDGAGGTMTLGDINLPATPGPSLPLYERTANSVASVQTPLLLFNIGDFNHIMRVCNEVEIGASGSLALPTTVPAILPSVTPPTDRGVISGQLFAAIAFPVTQVQNSQCPQDAGIHFDFRTPGWAYNSSGWIFNLATGLTVDPYVAPATPPGGMKDGDYRAMGLLDYITLTDRVSDYTIDLGDNQAPNLRGISKLRIPGRINVNTASPEVLSSIPYLSGKPQVVGAIIAYRLRIDGSTLPAPYTVAIDFSDHLLPTSKYPGYGIHSLGELEIPLSADATSSGAALLDTRDAAWASIYNLCTVHSDTFAVYGYIEAVRQHPRYASATGMAAFDNAKDWYNNKPYSNTATLAAPNSITDDPNDPLPATLLRLSRRRFVAIIDSSSSNFVRTDFARYTPPKIVAIKELPN